MYRVEWLEMFADRWRRAEMRCDGTYGDARRVAAEYRDSDARDVRIIDPKGRTIA